MTKVKKMTQNYVTRLQECLRETFKVLADCNARITLMMRKRPEKYAWIYSGDGSDWQLYFGTTNEEGLLKEKIKGLKQENSLKDVKEYLKSCLDDVLYLETDCSQKDSRVEAGNCGREQELIWIVQGKKSESVEKLISVIMGKTREQLTDLFLLSCWKDGNSIDELLFHYVRDYEDIMKCYIKKIFKEANLPETNLITLISAQKYEGPELLSRIYFANNAEQEVSVSFLNKDDEEWEFSEKNLRFIRKILETTGKENALAIVTDENKKKLITGITKVKDEEGIQISFGGYLKWSMRQNGNELLKYEDGRFSIPKPNAAEDAYKEKIRDLEIESIGKIIQIIDALIKQKHGTSIVFIKNNVLEKVLERLRACNRAYQVEMSEDYDETQLSELLVCMSAIDGALIADYDGNIHAIGVILDGPSVVRANAARGARFNSLQNFVNWLVKSKQCKKNECFSVIISEDETVDVESSDESKWVNISIPEVK